MDSVKMTGLDLEGLFKSKLKQTETEPGAASTGSDSSASSFAAALASNIIDFIASSSKATETSSSETCGSPKESGLSSDVLAGMDIGSYAGYLTDMTSELITQNDSDGDGYLSASDTSKLGMSADDFAVIDSNGDEKLSANELNEIRAKMDIPQMTSNLIDSNDSSGEGLLSASDVSMSTSDFNAIDTDKDSLLSSDELNTVAYSMLSKTLAVLQSDSIATNSAGLSVVA